MIYILDLMGTRSVIIQEEKRKENMLEAALKDITYESRGVQIGAVNGAIESSCRFQIGACNYAIESRGVQIGAFNGAIESRGVQIGAVNGAEESSYGFQIGAFNGAIESRGVQIGGINYAYNKLIGIQLGLLLNNCGPGSVGIQVGIINVRRGNPWYSKIIPILAVRTNYK